MATPTFPKKPAAPINAKPVPYAPKDLEVKSYLPEIFRGVGVSMRHFFDNTREMIRGKRPDPVLDRYDDGITTISYPEQKRPYPERFRGVHRLTQREDGSPRCVACLCCSTACPAQCIFIEAGEYPEGDKRRGYERYPVKFVIDELRCIFCGYCVEACPVDAITHGHGFELAAYNATSLVYRKEQLLAITPAHEGDNARFNVCDERKMQMIAR
jgi:NADH-quinone oxidoreductase subunit I